MQKIFWKICFTYLVTLFVINILRIGIVDEIFLSSIPRFFLLIINSILFAIGTPIPIILDIVLINCSRTIFPMEKDAMRWANYIGNRLFAILLSNLTNQKISDALCGTKVFSRELFEKMKNNGSWYSKQDPFGDFTILFQASKNHNKILNYPVRYYARKAGSPNISRWIDGLKLLKISIIFWMS